MPKAINNDIKNILIIRLSSIGDVLKCTVVIDKLRNHFPNARISWLVETKSKDVLLGNPNIDEIIVWQRKEWSKQARSSKNYWKFARQLFQFTKEIRNRNFDLVVDIYGAPRSGIISYLSKAPVRLCYTGSRKYSHLCANIHAVPDYTTSTTATQFYADILRPLGIDRDDLRMQMPILPADRSFAETFLHDHGISPGKYIAINPSTSWQSKCWPSEYYARLADMIIEKHCLPVVILGAPGDVPLVETITRQMQQQPVDASGKTTLRQLAALAEKAGAFISGDTGPLFIAEAAGTATISIFGPTDPAWHAPKGERHITLSTNSCSCKKSFCEDKKCLTAILPEHVLTTFEELAKKIGLIEHHAIK
ncbi:hypothetical protein SPSIL_042990 [Sporomusa silvacetica DSM 10669]|uniref:Lipopolysaccharide core heptosyltransferase RfaQ n=1 Tax=Sporomusa silvacetica DSM 10669 TaxID=1123289 RepID=A0ABZ3IQU4_9FIRM|nr:glycosyltransferase family 9 protein [Sporomusa silvacetica]OZC20560.1 lipopolysaccharide core heptosyltransferase RfaQ [Sporomusa silvacetica DSM 10669]